MAHNPPLQDHSFSPGPNRVVASEDLSVPTAPSVEDTGDGDGTESPYHPFNEHFGHHNGGSPDTSQPDGDGADNGYSPIYGENPIFSQDWQSWRQLPVRCYYADSII